ncbi:unnamed protein product [Ilex paraguariensis]|uniref:Glycosyltransferase N-terminal domain-containing protein n=1 Tax=Ilex paraguariensis TaxID=185542 RepID=A0ABC8RAE2_9AQUA
MASHQDDQGHKNGLKQARVVVIMVPFPAQGHLNQLLQLSCLIASYGLPVHYVGSATHNRQAKLRANGLDPLHIDRISFHDFPTPAFPSPPPNPNSSNKFPVHLHPSWEASQQLRQPVAALLKEISSTSQRIIIIHDILMASIVQDAASIPNAESYVFTCISAFTQFFTVWEAMGKPFQVEAEPEELPSLEGCFTSDFKTS